MNQIKHLTRKFAPSVPCPATAGWASRDVEFPGEGVR